jgi:peptide/nickel transport system substrate-binding protein
MRLILGIDHEGRGDATSNEPLRQEDRRKESWMNRHRSRSFGSLVIALVTSITLSAPWTTLAQDRSSSPVPNDEPIRSLMRDEFLTQLQEDMRYTEAATLGGTLIESSTSDIQTVHPFLAEEVTSLSIVGLLYERLIGGDVRTGQPAPTGLADSWEIAPDGVTYTFHLNKDAKWHDGVDVTAADVQFSFDALANPDTGSVYTGAFINSVESWRALDDDTMEVVAKEPLFTFLYDLVTWIIPKHIWETVPVADWRNDPGATGTDASRVIGSGPFKFQEWRQGESITLVRNDDYYGKVPYINSYVLRVWPDQTAVVNALLNGEIDAATLEPSDIAAVEGSSGIQVAHYPTSGFTYYEFNLDPEVTTKWQDQRVRQALLYALDRESIVNHILLGYAEVAQGTQPVISYAYAPHEITTRYTYDPEKAKALLSEAGWTDTDGDGIVDKDGEALSFELLYASGSPTNDQLVAYMQDAWAAIGVEATPRSLEFTALIEATTTNPTFEIALYNFFWDASFLQDVMFGCDQYQVGFNDMKYCNPELDQIHDQAKRTFDEEARRELLIQASNIVNEDQPVGIMYFRQDHAAYSDRLRNYIPSTWGVDLSQVWIQQ